MRPTKERIEEIRNYLDRQNKLSNFYRDTNTDLLVDLLAEIDGLRAERDEILGMRNRLATLGTFCNESADLVIGKLIEALAIAYSDLKKEITHEDMRS